MTTTPPPMAAAICRIVAAIPYGRVMSYGAVARAAGFPRHARHVARAMRQGPDGLPWFRVVNSHGGIAARGLDGEDDLQRVWLEAEGHRFDENGRLDLAQCAWPVPD